MRKRMIIVISILAVVLVAIGSIKFLQIRAAIAQGAGWQPPPEAVTTIKASEVEWATSLTAIGSVEAVHGVIVSADLPGIVEAVNIDSGRRVGSGDILVRQDTRQEQAQLVAAESQRDLAQLNLARGKQLLDKGVVAQAEYDQLDAESKQAAAHVGEIRATIDRKRIRAPFSGVLGIRQVNKGQYLKGGDPVVPLQSMDPIYVNFALPQGDVSSLKLGAEVAVSADSVPGVFAGRVTAVNSIVDEATRNVMVQATLRNPTGLLRPGMFVQVEASRGKAEKVIALPASSVSYAPYGNSVFVVSQLKGPNGKAYAGVSQRFVKLGEERGDQVAVVSGLKPGEEVVTSGVFKLRNGAAVFVNNKVRPSNDPAPKPEDS
jgi:membrane fusion protein (multidrug efflux system)